MATPAIPSGYTALDTNVFISKITNNAPKSVMFFAAAVPQWAKQGSPGLNPKVFVTPVWDKEGKNIESWAVKVSGIGLDADKARVIKIGKEWADPHGLRKPVIEEGDTTVTFTVSPKPGSREGHSEEFKEFVKKWTGQNVE